MDHQTKERAPRFVLPLGIAIFLVGVGLGFVNSVIRWAGPHPTLEFLRKTDWGRISVPSFLAPPTLTFILFPAGIPCFAVITALIFIGFRWPRRWPFAILGFIALAAYWFWMVQVAWSFD